MGNAIPIIGGERPEPQGPIANEKQLAYVLSEVHDDASPVNIRRWLTTAQTVWDRIRTHRTLPDPKGPCSCYPHWEFTDWGQPDQYLPEYDPACPEHSVHLYDPKSGTWILRGEETVERRIHYAYGVNSGIYDGSPWHQRASYEELQKIFEGLTSGPIDVTKREHRTVRYEPWQEES